MTRYEALKKLKEVVEAGGGCISERSISMSLDGYVALGMIKLDDECDEIGQTSAEVYSRDFIT